MMHSHVIYFRDEEKALEGHEEITLIKYYWNTDRLQIQPEIIMNNNSTD